MGHPNFTQINRARVSDTSGTTKNRYDRDAKLGCCGLTAVGWFSAESEAARSAEWGI